MSNFSESDIIPFALATLKDNPKGITTSELIKDLRKRMQPSGDDLEILAGRNDDKFSQKVRNLKSHKTLENKKFATFNDEKFYITTEGFKYLLNNQGFFPNINILESWELTTRTFNVLKDNGIFYLNELLEWSEKKFLTIPKFGQTGINEIKNHLVKYNLKLGMKRDEINEKKIEKNLLNIDKIENNNVESNIEENETNYNSIYNDFYKINILSDWPLSVRTFNALKNENIVFLGDLISLDTKYLLKLRNFGKKSLDEINDLFKKFHINIEELYKNFNLTFWIKERELLDVKEVQKEIRSYKPNLVNKSILKDYDKFKQNFFNNKKILINENIDIKELENLILKDIEKILSSLKDNNIAIFKGRYGYKENYKTLEELGLNFKVTRERIRQIEKIINLSISKLSSINSKSLISFFKKYEYISFHKLFPKLDSNFTYTTRGIDEITGNKLTTFIETYCGVKNGYFKTPERELWDFDAERLKEIFIFTPSGILTDNFIEIIKNSYGYNEFTSKLALEFMNKRELIKIINKKIYPIKINKNEEVAHILLDYPEGLHWRKICEIGNQSYTKNKWNLNRILGDSSLTMNGNPYIYLRDRGKYMLLKYLLLKVDDKDKLISLTIEILNKLNLKQSDLEKIFKKIIKIKKYHNLNFYDFRAIIKIFGKEKNLYHSGKSGQNTISFNKNIQSLSLKDKILEIIQNSDGEISQQEINLKLQKSNEQLNLYVHLDILEEENKIFKINPGIYLSYENGIKLCNKNEVIVKIETLFLKHSIITSSFIREILNEEFEYNYSILYFNTLLKIFSLEKNWFYKEKYLSKEYFDYKELKKQIENSYDVNLNINENFNKISKNIGITMLEIMDLRREINKKFKIN